MKPKIIYIDCLLALVTFFWLFVFIFMGMPYPLNFLLLGNITLALLIVREKIGGRRG